MMWSFLHALNNDKILFHIKSLSAISHISENCEISYINSVCGILIMHSLLLVRSLFDVYPTKISYSENFSSFCPKPTLLFSSLSMNTVYCHITVEIVHCRQCVLAILIYILDVNELRSKWLFFYFCVFKIFLQIYVYFDLESSF